MEETLEAYGARVELMYRACTAAGIAVPGVEALALQHEVPPGGEMVMGYLKSTLPLKPELRKAVLIAIYRFSETRQLALAARRHLALGIVQVGVIEQIRQQLYYLGRYFADFQQDPVLVCFFPPPKVVTTAAPAPGGWSSARQAESDAAAVREQTIQRADAWAAWIAPRMARVETVVAIATQSTPLSFKELMTPQGRQARLVALSLAGQAEVVARLATGVKAFEALQAALQAAHAGGDTTGLPALVATVDELAFACRQDPLLRDLFPADDEPPVPRPA